MFIKVFTPEECVEIASLNSTSKQFNHLNYQHELAVVKNDTKFLKTYDYIQKAKTHVMKYLESQNITVSNSEVFNEHMKYMIHISSTKDAKIWHYDDLPIINFIINIRGEGTKVLIDGNIDILPQGYGCMVIGEMGYNFFGLNPVLHCAPQEDKERCIMKIAVESSPNVTDYLTHASLCKYKSDEFNKRSSELETILLDDMKLIQKAEKRMN